MNRLALTLTLLLFIPATANSQTYIGPAYHESPASYVYADALLREAAYVADIRWRNMGYLLFEQVDLRVYDEPEHPRAVAYANRPGNTVWFARFYRDYLWETRQYRSSLQQMCQIMVHERGHNLGFPHIKGTILEENSTVIPRECREWSYDKIPVRSQR